MLRVQPTMLGWLKKKHIDANQFCETDACKKR